MTNVPAETVAPARSAVSSLLPGAYFHDAWVIRAAEPGLDALGQFLRVASSTPRWVEQLMALRNRIVAAFGLKNLGGLGRIDASKKASDYVAGDRVGIFTLISNSANEVLLGDNDKHLNVVLSVHKQNEVEGEGALVTVTTVVHVHNWLGRLYMVPVAPAHRVIAKTMVCRIGLVS